MKWFSRFVRSTLGRKVIMGVTGLLLIGFHVVHLLGNLSLLNPDKNPFNKYAEFLRSLGTGLLGAEFLLVTVFLTHIIFGILITWENRKARRSGYEESTKAGSPSKKSIFSTTKIYTGAFILIFLFIHVWQLKFGGTARFLVNFSGRVKYLSAEMPIIMDFYTFVHRYFAKTWNVVFYSVIMVLLGLHLGHGFWSAFQSLGVNHPKYTPVIYRFGYVLAAALAGGFFFIPLWIYFRGGGI